MDSQESDYDHDRYKQLLAEAVDETTRLELIDLMIRERARDRLLAWRASGRAAMVAAAVAGMLGQPAPRPFGRDS
ncbi:hypothetical protein [Bradyrhizobium sp.]|uniref:hypothetical protein n=1 Tax=Bradyrhizobium sp. TaxID=376 RepID=UPI0025BD2A59|nr:hypothetical protein [Bradyrhizobium sp.]